MGVCVLVWGELIDCFNGFKYRNKVFFFFGGDVLWSEFGGLGNLFIVDVFCLVKVWVFCLVIRVKLFSCF